MRKSVFKTVAFFLALIITLSCFSSFNILADESYDIFTYRISGNEAVLTKVANMASGEITVPDTLGGYSVTVIDGAFSNKSKVTGVTIPDTVTTITANSFSYCAKLKNINFSSNLVVIGEAAFCGCVSLEKLDLPDSVSSIAPYAFAWCEKLSTVKLPGSLDVIEKSLFSGCRALDDIDIPDSVAYIMQGAFYQTKYYNTESNWENNVLYIGSHLIEAKTTITGVCEVKPGTKSVASRAFNMCKSLEGVIIYNDTKTIGEAAFYGCSLLADVYYGGTVDNRRKLDVGKNNNFFSNALWHYNYNPDVKEYVPGDINGDDVVNMKDALRLLKYHSGWDVEVIESVLDVNGDNAENNKDITRLLKHLSGWDVKIYSKNVGAEFDDDDHGPVISF